jgi:outer membrane lipoprotein-sorting protein
MKRIVILIAWMIAAIGIFLQGCQSQQADEASEEKIRKLNKDFTPEKYRESQEKPKKPYWDKTR